ncbi:hypothetical protein Calni_0946 [Calditerrivibrio nitroreducens DSM 19672]|uniref:DUF2802 domain-containing protein n=2 Tax=Calditerrivibrio nitroreducens TaxID=477976 RepID=E4THN2_CALNY|nr:hypothetical protein Calni_0946 [Calditerrivibrio nitroreducens DSM 19672]
MNFAPILIILFILNFLMLILIGYLFLKFKSLQRKLVDVSYDDVKVITDTLKDLVVESEKVSEKLDISIKEKEALLEDLVDLIDAKLKRLEQLGSANTVNIPDTNNVEDSVSLSFNNSTLTNKTGNFDLSGMSLKEKVVFLSQNGMAPVDVAKRLGISVTEVNLVLKHGR